MTDYESLIPSRTIRNISITQILVGVMCLIWQTVNLVIGDLIGFVGTGLWCGATFIIAGGFGLNSLKTSQPCGLGSWLVFSLLAIPLSLTLLAFSIIGTFLESVAPQEPSEDVSTPYPMREEKMSFDIILAVCALTALVVSIMASILSCRGLCRIKQVQYQNMNNEDSSKNSSDMNL